MKPLLLFAVLCALCGCQTPKPMPINAAQAVAIARQAADDRNIALWYYQKEQVDYYPALGGWVVLWPNPDNTKGFEVVVNDKTGKVVRVEEVTILPGPPPN